MANPPPIPSERLFADTQWLQRVARALVHDPHAAEDLAQDAWLAALRARAGSIANRRAWLRRLFTNRLVSARRNETARHEREREAARVEALPSTAELCERAELQRVLGEAMLELEEPFRTTVLLRFLEGLAPAEIAERQGVSANTVRWRLRRGVAVLRERLERELGKNGSLALFGLVRPGAEVLAAGVLPATAIGTAIMVKKTLLIGSLLLATGFLAAYVFRDSAVSPGVVTLTPPAAEPELAEAKLAEANRAAEAPSRSTERLAMTPDESGVPSPSSSDAAPEEMATILFEAVARENGRPLAGVAAMPEVRGKAIVEYTQAKLNLSDSAGELRLAVPAHERIHVQAWGVDPLAGVAVLDLEPLAAGEERHVRLELPTTVDLTFFGRLIDESSGEPLAEVKIVTQLPSGLSAAIEEASTDLEGIFELRVPAWRSPWFNASCAEYGRITFRPVEGHATRAEALELELPRAATVVGRVGFEGSTETPAEVVFEANTRDVQRPRPKQMAFWTQQLWSAEVDAGGSYRIEGLNAGARYSARLLFDGELAGKLNEDIVLQAGETRRIDWLLGNGAAIRGLILDQDDEPLAEHELWMLSSDWNRARRFVAGDGRLAVRTLTDLAGRFQFEDVRSGIWLIGPAAVRSGPASRIASWAVPVEIEARIDFGALELKAWRELAIRGRVVDPDGRPIPNPSIRVESEDGHSRSVTADEEGRFEALGLRPVQYTLTAGGMGSSHARSAPESLRPGEREVELHARAAGSIRGRVLGSSGLASLGNVLISARHPANPYDDWRSVPLRDDGYFQLEGLSPGVYDIIARGKDGLCTFVRGHRVAEGPVSEELLLELEASGRLDTRVAKGQRELAYDLYLDGAFIGYGYCTPDRTESHSLPQGTIEVRYHDELGKEAALFAEVRIGETTELELGAAR